MNVYVTPPGVPGAPSTGTGTSEDPFTSIADGIKAAQNGGTVHLHGGHYVESVEVGRCGSEVSPTASAAN